MADHTAADTTAVENLEAGDQIVVEYTGVNAERGSTQTREGRVLSVKRFDSPASHYLSAEVYVSTDEGDHADTMLSIDGTPEGDEPMVDVRTSVGAHDTVTKQGRVTSVSSSYRRISRYTTATLFVVDESSDEPNADHDDDSDESDDAQPDDETLAEMAEVVASMGPSEREAFDEYLADLDESDNDDAQPETRAQDFATAVEHRAFGEQDIRSMGENSAYVGGRVAHDRDLDHIREMADTLDGEFNEVSRGAYIEWNVVFHPVDDASDESDGQPRLVTDGGVDVPDVDEGERLELTGETVSGDSATLVGEVTRVSETVVRMTAEGEAWYWQPASGEAYNANGNAWTDTLVVEGAARVADEN